MPFVNGKWVVAGSVPVPSSGAGAKPSTGNVVTDMFPGTSKGSKKPVTRKQTNPIFAAAAPAQQQTVAAAARGYDPVSGAGHPKHWSSVVTHGPLAGALDLVTQPFDVTASASSALWNLLRGDNEAASQSFGDALSRSTGGTLADLFRGTPRDQLGQMSRAYSVADNIGKALPFTRLNEPDSLTRTLTGGSAASVLTGKGFTNALFDAALNATADPTVISGVSLPVAASKIAYAGGRAVADAMQATRDIAAGARAARIADVRIGKSPGAGDLTPLQIWNMEVAGRKGSHVVTPSGKVVRTESMMPRGGTMVHNKQDPSLYQSYLQEIRAAGSAGHADALANQPITIPNRDMSVFGQRVGIPQRAELLDIAMRMVPPGEKPPLTAKLLGYSDPANPSRIGNAAATMWNVLPNRARSGVIPGNPFTTSGGLSKAIHAIGQDARRAKDIGEAQADKGNSELVKAFRNKVRDLSGGIRVATQVAGREAEKNSPSSDKQAATDLLSQPDIAAHTAAVARRDAAVAAGDQAAASSFKAEADALAQAAAHKYHPDEVSAGISVETALPRYVGRRAREDEQFAALAPDAQMNAAYNDFRNVLKNYWDLQIPDRSVIREHFLNEVNDMRSTMARINATELGYGLKRGERDAYVMQVEKQINDLAARMSNARKMTHFDNTVRKEIAADPSLAAIYGNGIRTRYAERPAFGSAVAVNPRSTATSMREASLNDWMEWLLPKHKGGIATLPELNHLELRRLRLKEHSRLMAAQTASRSAAQWAGVTPELLTSPQYLKAAARAESLQNEIDDLNTRLSELRSRKGSAEEVKSISDQISEKRQALAEMSKRRNQPLLTGDDVHPEVTAAQQRLDEVFATSPDDAARVVAARNALDAKIAEFSGPTSVPTQVPGMPLTRTERNAYASAERVARRGEIKENYKLGTLEGKEFDTVARGGESMAREIHDAIKAIDDATATLDRAMAQQQAALDAVFSGNGIPGKGKRKPNASGAVIGRGGARANQTQFTERSRERLADAREELQSLMEIDTGDQVLRAAAAAEKVREIQAVLKDVDKMFVNEDKRITAEINKLHEQWRIEQNKAGMSRAAEVAVARKGVRDAKKDYGYDTSAADDLQAQIKSLEKDRAAARKARDTVSGTVPQFVSIGKKLATNQRKLRDAQMRVRDFHVSEAQLIKIPGKRVSKPEYDNLADNLDWRPLSDSVHYELTLVSPENKAAIDRMMGTVFGVADSKHGPANAIIALAQELTSVWKRLALAKFGYGIRNMIGDVIAMAMGGFRDPTSFITGYRLTRTTKNGGHKWTTQAVPGFDGMTYNDLRDEVNAMGLRQAGFAGADVKEVTGKANRKSWVLYTLPDTENPNIFTKRFAGRQITLSRPAAPGYGHYSSWLRHMNEGRENVVRAAMYVEMRRQGLDPHMARANTLKWLFDYGDVAPAVATARRFLLPFIVYPVKMYPRLLETLAFNPKAFSIYGNIQNTMHFAAEQQNNGIINLEDVSPADYASFAVPTPGWLNAAMGVDQMKNGTSLPIIWNAGTSVPFAQLNVLSGQGESLTSPRGWIVGALKSAAAPLNPSLQAMAQAAGYDPRNFSSMTSDFRRAPWYINMVAKLTGAEGADATSSNPNSIGGLIDYVSNHRGQDGSTYGVWDSRGSAALMGMIPPLQYINTFGAGLFPSSDEATGNRVQSGIARNVTGFDIKPFDQVQQRANAIKYGRP